jgi:3-methyl-2-oxobutanoate hydroxymethyltransferase
MKTINIFKKKHRPIVMTTAYDYVSAKVSELAGIDALLVGDSLGMVIGGNDTTLKVTIEQMILHTQYAANGAKDTFLISDMPFMTYKTTPKEAVKNGGLLIQKGGADAVKLEGGNEICRTIKKMVFADIPVMGHIGLTPQAILKFGRYKKIGKNEKEKKYLLDSAKKLQDAGAFAIVLESIPEQVAKEITESVSIPTIGIGAGKYTDGQILVWNDILGFYDKIKPRFAKRYKDLWNEAIDGLSKYKDEVKKRKFPSEKYL